MNPSTRQLEALVDGLDNEAQLPQLIHGWIDQLEGDPLEPTAAEMGLAGVILNSIDEDDLSDQLGDLIHDLKVARSNLEPKT